MSHTLRRLSLVPEVFTAEEFSRPAGMSHEATGLHLVRLKHGGLVATAGPRADSRAHPEDRLWLPDPEDIDLPDDEAWEDVPIGKAK